MDAFNLLSSALMQSGNQLPQGTMNVAQQPFNYQDQLLAGLLAQQNPQMLGQVAETQPDPTEVGDITVTGTAPKKAPAVFDLAPTPRMFRPAEKPEGVEHGYKLGERNRGFKQVLGDIFGTLGDAFLVNSKAGGQSYEDWKEQLKIADAMEIYRKNPEEGIRAINSVNPKFAYDLEQDAEDNKIKRMEAQRKVDSDELRKMSDGLKAWGVIGQTANAIKDQASYERMKPVLMNLAIKYDIPLELPDTYDPAVINDLVSSQMGRWREQRLFQLGQNVESLIQHRGVMQGQGQQRLEQGQQNLELKEREVTRKEKKDAADDDGLGGRPAAATNTGQYDKIQNGYGLIKGKSGELRSHWVKLN